MDISAGIDGVLSNLNLLGFEICLIFNGLRLDKVRTLRL
jgi:hypothetical protein